MSKEEMKIEKEWNNGERETGRERKSWNEKNCDAESYKMVVN